MSAGLITCIIIYGIVLVVGLGVCIAPRVSTKKTDKDYEQVRHETALGIFISLLWPLALAGLILYGIWRLLKAVPEVFKDAAPPDKRKKKEESAKSDNNAWVEESESLRRKRSMR